MSDVAAATVTIGGRAPQRVLRPGSLQELAAIVRERDGTTLVPVGSGLHQGIGGPPRGEWSAVMLRDALGGPVSHQEDDLTVVAPAGLTLGEINAILAEKGQRLPLDPPLAESATLGGVLAANPGGPLRSRFGLPRDLVLGMTTLRADGELVRAGGRVVKNVTGYDLIRLWCGSLGTLGIITEAALRVYPLAATVTLSARAATVEEAISCVESLYRADLRPEVADVVVATGEVGLLLRLPVIAAAAARRLAGGAEARDGGDALYASVRDAGYPTPGGLVIQASAPPSRLAGVATDVLDLHPTTMVVRPLAPLVRAAWEPGELPAAAAVATLVTRLRSGLAGGWGSVVVEAMPPAWTGDLDPWGSPAGGLAVMQRLKAAYDPDGRFNRGRFAGGI